MRLLIITVPTIVFLWTCALTCLAQFNDTTHYYTNFTSTGAINRTQDGSSYLLNNAFRFSEKKKSIALNFNNNWVYGRSNDDLTNNDFSTSLDFNLYKSIPHFYYWGLVNYVTSYSLKINNQFLGGVGGAYNLIDKKNIMLNLSDGVLYDRGDLFIADDIRDNYHTFRNSFRLLYRFVIKDIVTLDGSNFVQNSFSRRNDYIIRSTTNLSVRIRKWLSFTTSLNYNRMNRTHSENTLLNYGLTIEKYF
nr:DUF481 domain-containing protein [Mucilaginibacter straminoryzae]